MWQSTPARTLAMSPISPTPAAVQWSQIDGAASSVSRGTPIQNIPLPNQPRRAASPHLNRSFPLSPTAGPTLGGGGVASYATDDVLGNGVHVIGGESSGGTVPQYQDTIIPFHLDLSEQLLSTAASTLQPPQSPAAASHRPPPISVQSIHLTKDQLFQLQVESSEYVDNLGLTLRSLFDQDNAKLRKTISNTNSIPMTFLLFRLQQQMLKLSGDYDSQRERKLLHHLASLLNA